MSERELMCVVGGPQHDNLFVRNCLSIFMDGLERGGNDTPRKMMQLMELSVCGAISMAFTDEELEAKPEWELEALGDFIWELAIEWIRANTVFMNHDA